VGLPNSGYSVNNQEREERKRDNLPKVRKLNDPPNYSDQKFCKNPANELWNDGRTTISSGQETDCETGSDPQMKGA